MSLIHRALLVTVALAVVGVSVLLVGWATRPNLTILYAGLPPEEAGQIVDKLRERGVPFELAGCGRTVLASADQVDALRMSLAQDHLPSGGGSAGYSLLDEEKIGTSPFKERINYIRAREGELARAIQTLEDVVYAKVLVNQPENSLFAGQRQKSSASVTIRTRGGRRLTPERVAAIQHLVAMSVQDLQPESVGVVDTLGNLLSGEDTAEGIGRAGSFQAYRSAVEQELAVKAEDLLALALGPNRSSVQVSVRMKSSSVTTQKETVDPVNRVMTRETIEKSTPSGAGDKTEKTEAEYLTSKTITQTEEVPGEIVSKSVAVLVDLTPRKTEDGEEAKTMTKEDVEALVRGALGLQLGADGGQDALSVVTTSFQPVATAAADAGGGGMFSTANLVDIAERASLGLLVIGALLALKLFGGSKKEPQAALPNETKPAQALAAAGGGKEALLTASEADSPNQLRDRLTRALRENPEEVKRLFMSWVQSDQGGGA